jgi:hypothetical protein
LKKLDCRTATIKKATELLLRTNDIVVAFFQLSVPIIYELCVTFSIPLKCKFPDKTLSKYVTSFYKTKSGKKEVEDFAWNIITSDEYQSDDEVIDDTLFEWDNEEINVPINNVNMQLWKKRLLTGNDELIEHNVWNVHIEQTKIRL